MFSWKRNLDQPLYGWVGRATIS